MVDQTEKEWIEKTKKGDQTAFKQLVEKYQNLIAATVIGMVGQIPEADDIGQETFIRFYQSLGKFRGESSVGTYLTRIAINLSLNELRRRKRQNTYFYNNPEGNPEDFSKEKNTEEKEDINQIVRSSVQKLEPKYRSVIVLRLINGYSTKETSQILNVPLGTVLSRLARGQERLKKILTPLLRGAS